MSSPRIAFVYQNRRAALAAEVAAGRAPDTTLLGQNHLAALGLDARVHDPLLTRRDLPSPLAQRLAWNVRELALPLELRGFDVAFTPLGLLFPLAARAVRHPRVVVVNYGLNTMWARSSPPRRALLRASLRSAAGVVCLGESQRSDLIARVGIPADRVRTLLLPVDETYFTPAADLGSDDGLVLTVGKDLARDFGTFASAVQGLDAPVHVAAYPRNLEGVTLPPGARVGVVDAPGLRALYARARCVVLPQRPDGYLYGSEGGGLTALLEAMAMGKAVVATDRAILRDYVRDEESALIVPPENPEALAAAIRRVLGDRELALALGRAARARVERAHSTRGFAAQLARILVAAAGQSG